MAIGPGITLQSNELARSAATTVSRSFFVPPSNVWLPPAPAVVAGKARHAVAERTARRCNTSMAPQPELGRRDLHVTSSVGARRRDGRHDTDAELAPGLRQEHSAMSGAVEPLLHRARGSESRRSPEEVFSGAPRPVAAGRIEA